jgi:hypothetical protein
VRFTKAGKRRLARRRVRLTISLTATDLAGNRTSLHNRHLLRS